MMRMSKVTENVKTVEFIFDGQVVLFHGDKAELLRRVYPVEELTVDSPVLVAADIFSVSFSAPENKHLRCTFNEEKAVVDCQVY